MSALLRHEVVFFAKRISILPYTKMKGGDKVCCNSKKNHGGCQCGCHHGSSAQGRHSPSDRVFWTKAEKIAWLEQNLESLREEAQAIEERIGMLQAE